ncbi:hypothetical protein AX768_04920 [Burkholderia sp. PAMC 28687]|nr:hypothetical protein AX768_04920 [Burkholderia sp. PAMC 28687]
MYCEEDEEAGVDEDCGGGNDVDIRYSAPLAVSAGRAAQSEEMLGTAGIDPAGRNRRPDERRACRSNIAAKRARQNNMSEAAKKGRASPCRSSEPARKPARTAARLR